MPALFPLRLALTQQQREWLTRRSLALGKLPAQIVSGLLDTEIDGENTAGKLAELIRMMGESDARIRRMETAMMGHHDVTKAYLGELFRESCASLYRLEAIVADMDDPVSVRMQMNEHLRKKEREMNERVRVLHPQLK